MCYNIIEREVFYIAKTNNINIRIDSDTKKAVESLYGQFGITVSDAVNIFFRKSLMDGGLPFDMKQPKYNRETEAAMQEARDIMTGKIYAKSYSNAKELFEELDEEC